MKNSTAYHCALCYTLGLLRYVMRFAVDACCAPPLSVGDDNTTNLDLIRIISNMATAQAILKSHSYKTRVNTGESDITRTKIKISIRGSPHVNA